MSRIDVRKTYKLYLGGELGAAAFHDLGDAVEHLAAVVSSCRRPTGEGLAGGGHRVAEVFAGGVGRVGQEGALGIGDRVDPAGFRAGEFAANGELVGFGDGNPVRH